MHTSVPPHRTFGAAAVFFAISAVAFGAIAGDASPRTVEPPLIDAPVASASVSARRVILARSFYLVVRVVHAPGLEVSLPTNLSLGGAVEELRRTNASAPNPDGTLTREYELEVVAFTTGAITIPPIEVTYTDRGRVGTVRTNPIAFEVSGVIGDGEGTLRDISPPVSVIRLDLSLAYVVGGVGLGLVFLALVWLIVHRFRSRRRTRIEAIESRHLPADEQALVRLEEVEQGGALEQEDLKPAYLEMSDIIKTYIARRFGFPASELTTLEIRNELAARPAGESAESLIRKWLEAADLVKFANQQATSDEAVRALEEARTFVEKTRRGEAMEAVDA